MADPSKKVVDEEAQRIADEAVAEIRGEEAPKVESPLAPLVHEPAAQRVADDAKAEVRAAWDGTTPAPTEGAFDVPGDLGVTQDVPKLPKSPLADLGKRPDLTYSSTPADSKGKGPHVDATVVWDDPGSSHALPPSKPAGPEPQLPPGHDPDRPQPLSPPGGIAAAASPLSPLLAKADTSTLADKWGQAESGALDTATKGQPYGWGDAIRDMAPGALAALLDTKYNKGHGLGMIAAQTGIEAGHQQARQAAAKESARKFALAAHEQRDKMSTNTLGAARLAQAQETQQRIAEADKRDNDPASAQAQSTRALLTANGVPPAMIDGLSHRQMLNNPAFSGFFAHDSAQRFGIRDAADKESAVKQAELDTVQRNAPMSTRIAAQQAAATASAGTQARIGAEVAAAPAVTATKVAEQHALQPGQAELHALNARVKVQGAAIIKANPGVAVGDPELFQQMLSTPSTTENVLKDIQNANRGREIMQRLYDTVLEYQALPVLDQAGRKGAELRSQYENHSAEFVGVNLAIQHISSDSARKQALSELPDANNPLASDRIRGLWGGIEANADANLGAYGVSIRPPQFIAARKGGNGAPEAARKGGNGAPEAAKTIKVTRLKDGVTRDIPAADAEQYRTDPEFKVVE